MKRPFRPTCLALGAATLALSTACSDRRPPEVPAAKYSAEIRRTAFGVPHIKASDEGGLGFGVGYAYAQDNFCMLADEVTTINGERSRHFGPDDKVPGTRVSNLQSDFFFTLINDAPAIELAWQAQPEPMKALVSGYVAGYNLYLEETGRDKLPEACKNAAWVRKLTELDFIKVVRHYAIDAGSAEFIAAMVQAAPPGAVPAPSSGPLKAMDPDYWRQKRERSGSNGVALGKDATDNGSGMLLANPHMPWQGRQRFYQLHLTIPGKLDAMGASLGGMPMVNIGFNQHLAWTHTVNTASHFTVHELALDPTDPTRYLVDGKARAMTRKSVSIDVKDADGVIRQRQHAFYASEFGAVFASPGFEWSGSKVYTINDVNLNNHRLLEQWHAMAGATNVAELKSTIERIVGLPWVTTVAADKHGDALYMDVSAVPHVSLAKQAACVPDAFKPLAEQGIMVLSGATAACQTGSDSGAPQRGIFAGASLPHLQRKDYVQNSNDSAWLSNPAAPLSGFPPIVSIDGKQQSGRTRIGISQLQARLAGTDGRAGKSMSMAQLQELTLSNRVYFADQVMDDLLRACGGAGQALAEDGSSVELAGACATLAAWDRSANLDASLGYVYFAGLWGRIGNMPGLWAVPFNPADPVHTPRGLNLSDPSVGVAVRAALASTVQDVAGLGLPAGARWGDLQGTLRGGSWIPIHGGSGEFGVYNAIESELGADGRLHVLFGTSFVQTVAFDANGPHAQAMLSYSQSSDPASPHHGDQSGRFARKEWITQAFTEAQIKADPAYRSIRITLK